MRFLAAFVAALGSGQYHIDGVARMCERPIGDMARRTHQLGVKAVSEMGNGCPPIVIEADDRLKWGTVRIKGGDEQPVSSAVF